jgi:hypothetical protein
MVGYDGNILYVNCTTFELEFDNMQITVSPIA